MLNAQERAGVRELRIVFEGLLDLTVELSILSLRKQQILLAAYLRAFLLCSSSFPTRLLILLSLHDLYFRGRLAQCWVFIHPSQSVVGLGMIRYTGQWDRRKNLLERFWGGLLS